MSAMATPLHSTPIQLPSQFTAVDLAATLLLSNGGGFNCGLHYARQTPPAIASHLLPNPNPRPSPDRRQTQSALAYQLPAT